MTTNNMRIINLQPIKRIPFGLLVAVGSLAAILCGLSATHMNGQSGGPYSIERSVITSGGGSSSGGAFEVNGTVAQPITGGPSFRTPYLLYGGFWTPQTAPTAAPVTITGRVKTSADRGIRGAVVTLTSGKGHVASTATSTFGYYRFQNLEAGETYILTVAAPRYVFATPSALVTANDNIENLDFVANN